MNKPNRPQSPPASAHKKGNRPPIQQLLVKSAAPPAYRPQSPPRVLQPKAAATQVGKTSVAPPVYRPQPVPRCLQPKAATQRQALPGRVKATPSPPPVYRPQPTQRCLQRKTQAGTLPQP